eukprot:2762350-Lingulodinium_polyedra.AAC.1
MRGPRAIGFGSVRGEARGEALQVKPRWRPTAKPAPGSAPRPRPASKCGGCLGARCRSGFSRCAPAS